MPRIMADHNVEGHLEVLLNIWSSPAWGDAWEEMGGNLESFERLGIAPDTLDTDLWQLCQAHEIILLTGNPEDSWWLASLPTDRIRVTRPIRQLASEVQFHVSS
jgi:hypothetical protein